MAPQHSSPLSQVFECLSSAYSSKSALLIGIYILRTSPPLRRQHSLTEDPSHSQRIEPAEMASNMAHPVSTTPSIFPRTHLLSAIRARVTAASPDYVGSVTLSPVLCASAHLSHRQMVQIRVERTGFELWTYVIRAPKGSPDNQVCVNGAAAFHVKQGDVVCVAAYGRSCRAARFRVPLCDVVDDPPRELDTPLFAPADDVIVDIAAGKIHRPRITKVVHAALPSVIVDTDWLAAAGMVEGQQVHVVNVNNGQRDILIVRAASQGSRVCEMHLFGLPEEARSRGFGARSGYAEGDVIIIMAYCAVTTELLVAERDLPEMSLCFPYEIPEEEQRNCRRILEGCDS